MGQGTACRSAFKISGGPLVPPILRLFPVAPVAYHACRRDNDQGRRSFQARRTSAFKTYFKGFTILDFKGASSASLPSSAYFRSRLWPAMHAGATATKGDQSRPPYEGPNVQDFVQGPNVQGFEVASHPPPALPSFQTLTAFCLARGPPCMQARATATKGDQSRAPYEAGALRSRLRSRAQRSGLHRCCFLSSACPACLRSKPSPLSVSPVACHACRRDNDQARAIGPRPPYENFQGPYALTVIGGRPGALNWFGDEGRMW